MQRFIGREEDIEEALKWLLIDDFSVYGEDESLFAKMQEAISASTRQSTVPMRCITVMSVLPDEEQPKNGKLAVYRFKGPSIASIFFGVNRWQDSLVPAGSKAASRKERDDMGFDAIRRMGVAYIPEQAILSAGGGKTMKQNRAVFDELKRDRLLFAVTDTEKKRNDKAITYIVSRYALPTLGQRIELKGKAMMEPSPERDAFIAKKLDQPEKIQFIIKNAGGLTKTFMAASDRYKPLPLTAITDAYRMIQEDSSLGTMQCEEWSIDHSMSRIKFTFSGYSGVQDIADLYGIPEDELPRPGFEVISSDIGDCSFIIRGFWKIGGGLLYTKEVAKKHSGSVKVEEAVELARRSIFGEYPNMVRKLMELMETGITPQYVIAASAALDEARRRMQETKDSEDARKALAAIRDFRRAERAAAKPFEDHAKLLCEMIKSALSEVSMSTLQYGKGWAENVVDALDMSVPYTAYDLMAIILRTQLDVRFPDTAEKMRKSMAGLPDASYAKLRDAAMAMLALPERAPAALKDRNAAKEEGIEESLDLGDAGAPGHGGAGEGSGKASPGGGGSAA